MKKEEKAIADGKYELRKGRNGDRPVSHFYGKDNIPDYVLLYENAQIGAMNGDAGWIIFIEIFEPYGNKGHGTKFIELLEREARILGYKQIIVGSVTVPNLEHILEKRGYIIREGPDGQKDCIKRL